jgi:transcription termination factor Rho
MSSNENNNTQSNNNDEPKEEKTTIGKRIKMPTLSLPSGVDRDSVEKSSTEKFSQAGQGSRWQTALQGGDVRERGRSDRYEGRESRGYERTERREYGYDRESRYGSTNESYQPRSNGDFNGNSDESFRGQRAIQQPDYNQGYQSYNLNPQQDEQEEVHDEKEDANVDYANAGQNTTVLKMQEVRKKDVDQLMEFAKGIGIESLEGITRQEICFSLLKALSGSAKYRIYCEGVLEVLNDGYGFLRTAEVNYAHRTDDVYVSINQIKRFCLRTGDTIGGFIRPPKSKEKFFSLVDISAVNGSPHSQVRKFKAFDDLTPIYPQSLLNLEVQSGRASDINNRVIQLTSPIGKGQRALIVAPPRVGKTMLIQSIANAININHPEVSLFYLGIDERPEEFTEMQRTIKGEVVSSTFDETSARHVSLSEIVIGKAKRYVEQGKDVVILLDSITRLARAYNNVIPSSGKVLSGGVDSNALQLPKKFFGAARNIEYGGSLTIIATALIDTGSRMDEVIFEEFKGTGNCEIVLDRKIADKRIFPAIDILKSGTRKEEEMVSPEILSKMWMLRRIVSNLNTIEAIEFLIKKLRETRSNEEFFTSMNN